MRYTYTIFDADPNEAGGCVWPGHENKAIRAEDDNAAADAVFDIVESEAAGLRVEDGYEVGQTLYALIWSPDGSTITLRYRLTAEDLGVEEEDDEDL